MRLCDNVITALDSNGMIAPSYYVDPRSGNNYLETVQFPESDIKNLTDFKQIPLRAPDGKHVTNLGAVTNIRQINTPTEVDHYQIERVIDRVCLALERKPWRPGETGESRDRQHQDA